MHNAGLLIKLPTGCSLDHVQVIDACLQVSHGLLTILPLALMSLHALQKPEVRKRAKPHGTITETRGFLEHLHTLLPAAWNDRPIPIWNPESLTIFKRQLKTEHLTAYYEKKKSRLCFHLVQPVLF